MDKEEVLRLKKLAMKNHERAINYFNQAIKLADSLELSNSDEITINEIKEKINYIKFPTPFLKDAYKKLSLDSKTELL